MSVNNIAFKDAESWVDQHQTANLPGDKVDWLVKLRKQSIDQFSQLGFPTTRDEKWRYTNLRALKKNIFTLSEPKAVKEKPALPIIENAQLVFINGVFSEQHSNLGELAKGIKVRRLSDVLENNADSIKDKLSSTLPEKQHGFSTLNSAYCNDGYVIQLAKNTVYETPIEVLYLSTEAEQPFVTHTRNLIIAEQHSQCAIIERFIGSDKEAIYLNNCITEIIAEDGAHIDHYKIQQEAENAFHVGGVFIQQASNSTVNNHNFAFGGLVARSDISTNLNGEGAHCEMNGLVIGQGRQHTDNFTEVVHAKPHCTSDEYYKSILDDNSRTVFRGRIIVAEDAQLTNAEQQNKNLLLSKNAEADCKPQLEIYADDVKCSHGATVGQLNPKSIFYLQSRGINKETAKHLLTFAFANEIIERIKVDYIQQELTTLLSGQLMSDFEELL